MAAKEKAALEQGKVIEQDRPGYNARHNMPPSPNASRHFYYCHSQKSYFLLGRHVKNHTSHFQIVISLFLCIKFKIER